jgi:hypothetical protein
MHVNPHYTSYQLQIGKFKVAPMQNLMENCDVIGEFTRPIDQRHKRQIGSKLHIVTL